MNNSVTSGTSSRHITLNDKYYFAAYLNMARHNFFIILNDINSRMGFGNGPRVTDDAKLLDFECLKKLMKESHTPPDVLKQIIREIDKALPWIKNMLFASKKLEMSDELEEDKKLGEADIQKMEHLPEDYYRLLQKFIDTLNNFRNHYSHFPDQHPQFDIQLMKFMRTTFDAGVRTAKRRFSYSPDDAKHLVRQGKGGKELKEFRYKFWDTNNRNISLHGLVYFICLLLEKKYASIFTQRIEGLMDRRPGNSDSREKLATFEAFAIHCIHLPTARIVSDIPVQALAMDMLNELKRCPDELFPHLAPEKQNIFRVAAEVENASTGDDSNDSTVLMKRHEDRFVYFSLRLIDEQKWFSRLRFPVDLGNYHYFLYDKILDGQQRIGSLRKKIIGWGRLPYYLSNADIPPAYQELITEREDNDEKTKRPYIPVTTPHYHLPNDNISIRILPEGEQDAWPEISLIETEEDRKLVIPITKYRADVLISRYEMFALMFYGLLDDENPAELENDIIEHHSKRMQLYDRIKNGWTKPLTMGGNLEERKKVLNQQLKSFGLVADDLPGEIRDYLMSLKTTDFGERAARRIDALLADTHQRQERIEKVLKEPRRPGSKKDTFVKAGALADFLAKDILLFQPPASAEKANGKATSMLYQVLQAKLAMFGGYRDTIEATLKECGLIGSSNTHPFLQKVLNKNPRGIVECYIAYLKERCNYLKRCKIELAYNSYHWLKLNQAKRKSEPDYGQKLAAAMKEQPLVLPRGFFADRIKGALKAKSPKIRDAFNNNTQMNTSFMIKRYYDLALNDREQDFYSWGRVYQVFDNFFDKRPEPKRQPAVHQKLDEKERIKRFKEVKQWAVEKTEKEKGGKAEADFKKRFGHFEKNEKQLRLQRTQDMVLFQMAISMLKFQQSPLVQQENNFFLKDIMPDADRGILEKQIKYTHSQSYSCKDVTGNNNPEIKGCTRIVQNTIKVKNTGDFNRFLKDRRLDNLLALMNIIEINREALEKELAAYDKERIKVFEIILQFEKEIFETVPEIGKETIDFNKILETAVAKGRLDNSVSQKIRWIRHAFAHNQYPNAHVFSDLRNDKNHLTVDGTKLTYAGFFRQYLEKKLFPTVTKE